MTTDMYKEYQVLIVLNGVVFTSRPIGPAELEATKHWMEKSLPYNVVTVVPATE